MDLKRGKTKIIKKRRKNRKKRRIGIEGRRRGGGD